MNHPTVVFLHPRCTPDHVGFIPTFLNLDNPATARDQLDAGYAFAGGWRPQEGFTKGPGRFVLKYPGDPPLRPIATMQLRNETIMVYDHGYVAIWQPDGSFEACRMD